MKLICTAIFGPSSLMREGVAATVARSHFRVVLRSDWDEFCARRSASKIMPALCILIVSNQDLEKARNTVALLRNLFPSSCLVILMDEGGNKLQGIFDAGANGCLPLMISPEALLLALDLLIGRQVSIMSLVPSFDVRSTSKEPAAPITTSEAPIRTTKSFDHLSAREAEVLEAMSRGDSNKHIARRLNISEATVKAHVRIILRKIGAGNRTQAAVWALNDGDRSDVPRATF